jgi:arginase family enzyme
VVTTESPEMGTQTGRKQPIHVFVSGTFVFHAENVMISLIQEESNIHDEEGKVENKVIFFGCPFDCDEKHESIMEKRSISDAPYTEGDPLDAVMRLVRSKVPPAEWNEKGSIGVPSWLRPQPPAEDLPKINAHEFVAFIDQDGCRRMAEEVERFVQHEVLPDVPCMIAVDHSLTGGVYRAVANHYGKENTGLIILDSHTDAIPVPVLAEAIQYDIDTNQNSLHDRNDPLLYGRSNSYNASTFVYHLVKEGHLIPENLCLIGVSDYPQKKALRIKDGRIKDYVGVYTELRRRGVRILTNEDCRLKPSKVRSVLMSMDMPFIYVSVDMDIGSRNALEGVRFRDRYGLSEATMYRIAESIAELLGASAELAGMDITEINPRRAGKVLDSGVDRTYDIAFGLIKKIAFERPVPR